MKIDPRYKPELCASKDESRFNIMSPWLDPEAKAVLATDGIKLVVCPAEEVDGEARSVGVAQLALARHPDCAPMGPMTFPKWREVVPTWKEGDPGTVTIGLNAAFLRDIARALGARRNMVRITVSLEAMERQEVILVRALDASEDGDGAYGLLMPCRLASVAKGEPVGVVSVPPAVTEQGERSEPDRQNSVRSAGRGE